MKISVSLSFRRTWRTCTQKRPRISCVTRHNPRQKEALESLHFPLQSSRFQRLVYGNSSVFKPARVAKLADARDLKSRDPKGAYRFNSSPGHHAISFALIFLPQSLIQFQTMMRDLNCLHAAGTKARSCSCALVNTFLELVQHVITGTHGKSDDGHGCRFIGDRRKNASVANGKVLDVVSLHLLVCD